MYYGYLFLIVGVFALSLWYQRFARRTTQAKVDRCSGVCKAVCIDAYSERQGSELSRKDQRYILYINVWEYYVNGQRYTVLSSSQYIKYWVDKGTETLVHYNEENPADAWAERLVTKESRGKEFKMLLLLLVLLCSPCIIAVVVYLLGWLFA